MGTRFWAIIAVIVVIFVGILFFKDDSKDTANNGPKGTPTQNIKGDPAAKVKLVEYGDFQCPTCAAYHPLVDEIIKKYQDQISFQFSHLPLTRIHPHAFAAARVAEAAAKQDKFWEMYDLLFQNQTTWSQASSADELFEQYATQLGLDMQKFETDRASSAVNRSINADMAEFNKIEKRLGTPSFFLNGKKIELKQLSTNDQPDQNKFNKLIEAELKKQGVKVTPTPAPAEQQ